MKEFQVGDKVRVLEDCCRGKIGIIDRIRHDLRPSEYYIRSMDGCYLTTCFSSEMALIDDPSPRPGDWVIIADGKEPRKGLVIKVNWKRRNSHTVIGEDGIFEGWFALDQLQILERLPEEWEPEGVEIHTMEGEVLETGLPPLDVADEAVEIAKQHAIRLDRAVIIYHCRGYGIELETAQPR